MFRAIGKCSEPLITIHRNMKSLVAKRDAYTKNEILDLTRLPIDI